MGKRTERKRTTGIEWTEHTWNPFVGCSIHTAGCTNCYAMEMAARIVAMNFTPTYEGTVEISKSGRATWTGRLNRATDATMRKPFTVSRPSIFFVNSMSDFFHEDAPDEWRIEALGVMAATAHQYQVLTKRPENIAPFLERHNLAFPGNVWIGATVERGDFNHRIDTLRAIPARIRFLSVEPLIGPPGDMDLTGIHWVIGGGESGDRARPMRAEWIENVLDQCVAQRVRFFFKQWGTAPNNPLFYDERARRLAVERLGAEVAPARLAELTPAQWVQTFDPHGKGGSRIRCDEWKQYPDFGGAQASMF